MNDDYVIGGYLCISEVSAPSPQRLIFLAEDEEGEQVLLKLSARSANPQVQLRRQTEFEREVACGHALHHPNIRRLLKSGIDSRPRPPAAPLGYFWQAMEYVPYGTLRKRVESDPLTDLEIGEVLYAIFEGLYAAHECGIVHRDLKPENILLPGGIPRAAKISDFGIALVDGGERITTSLPNCTWQYAAPEQLRAEEEITSATDIYALALLAWELLSGGDVPGKGKTAYETERIRSSRLATPDIIRHGRTLVNVSRELRCFLEPDPDDRLELADFETLLLVMGENDGLWQMEWRPFDFPELLRKDCPSAEIIDRRSVGGALWIVDSPSFRAFKNGTWGEPFRHFRFRPEGGKASGGRPAWWSRRLHAEGAQQATGRLLASPLSRDANGS